MAYKPSAVTYRDQVMSRAALLALRRQMIDQVVDTLPNSKLFREGALYPRRYFDDLIVEQKNILN